MGSRDVKGSAVASAAEFDRQMVALATTLLRFERVADRMYEAGTTLPGMSVRFKGDGRSEYLVVLRASTSEGKFVSFHSADTLAEALRGMVARLENDTVKWKVDEYG